MKSVTYLLEFKNKVIEIKCVVYTKKQNYVLLKCLIRYSNITFLKIDVNLNNIRCFIHSSL